MILLLSLAHLMCVCVCVCERERERERVLCNILIHIFIVCLIVTYVDTF